MVKEAVCASWQSLQSPASRHLTLPGANMQVSASASPLILLPAPASRTEIKWGASTLSRLRRKQEKIWWVAMGTVPTHTDVYDYKFFKKLCPKIHQIPNAITENGVRICYRSQYCLYSNYYSSRLLSIFLAARQHTKCLRTSPYFPLTYQSHHNIGMSISPYYQWRE